MNREIVFFFACVLLTACGLNKQINTNNVSKPSSAKALITSIESKNKSPDWLSLKGKINLENNNSVGWEENDGIWYVKAARSGRFLYES